MVGELNLSRLLSSMEPVLHPEEFVFCTIAQERRAGLNVRPIMEFREDEGLTLVLQRGEAEQNNLSFIYPCKRITLNIHSSLEAVGFLAVITTKLAAAHLSVNPVSAYLHDHLFVPSEKAELAIKLLHELIAEQEDR